MNNQRDREVTQDIEEAFTYGVRPNSDELFGETWDDNIPFWESLIGGKHWREVLECLQDVNPSRPNEYNGMQYYLTPKALMYYLPALLIHSLDERSDSFGVDIYDVFTPVSRAHNLRVTTQSSEISELLSASQKQVICKAYTLCLMNHFHEYVDWQIW